MVGEQADAAWVKTAGDESFLDSLRVLNTDLKEAIVILVLVFVHANQYGPTVAGAKSIVPA